MLFQPLSLPFLRHVEGRVRKEEVVGMSEEVPPEEVLPLEV